jgi:putative flippase GtrA
MIKFNGIAYMRKMKLCKGEYVKFREIFSYLFFGALTTAVNILSYYVLTHFLQVYYLTANAAAWILSVSFAYVTNKIFVFNSKSMRIKDILREAAAFFGCRLFSGFVDISFMYVFVDIFKLGDVGVKLADNIVVIVLNYLFSKLVIFSKKN